MTLLVTPEELYARRAVARGSLEPLVASLARDLEGLLEREPFMPSEKAMLSRSGGRCPRDGTLLEFDPWSPHAHRCAACGDLHRGEAHDRNWILWYQLWLAERIVHAALLWCLTDGERFRVFAVDTLRRYALRYASYPNRDNVLGPSRLFFSTYLESVWLLQICFAVDLLEMAGDWNVGGLIRDEIILPARAIIGDYDEGDSNRQVWNNAALFASARLVDDAAGVERAVYGGSGILAHLGRGLLRDGTWYEGENYHLFAHRGLWYGVVMAAHGGLTLPTDLLDRFQEGFAAPLATALPDFTLPARRDSQFAISLRQWRIAEHIELGLARAPDARLSGALYRMYRDPVPRLDPGRVRSTADIERNTPPTALSRADLGWRALLHALPELPSLEPAEPTSVILRDQGIGVFRRDAGRVYAALDYGHGGGGHGHPDRLNLLLAEESVRWLDDFGTGSYVDTSLHWYRSTLAHNAPLVDGRSQQRTSGWLRAYDERGAAGWLEAEAEIAPGVEARRTLVVMSDYLIEELSWRSRKPITIDLPLHIDAELVEPPAQAQVAHMPGGDGTEDGFAFLRDAAVQAVSAGSVVRLCAIARNHATLAVWTRCDRDSAWWRAIAPGPPGQGDRAFRIVRATGATGSHRSVWAWRNSVRAVVFGDALTIALTDGTEHVHQRAAGAWHIDLLAAGARSSLDLAGIETTRRAADASLPPSSEPLDQSPRVLRCGATLDFALGEESYRRSEQTWDAAGRPAATVSLRWDGQTLAVQIDVRESDRAFAPSNAQNPYDNEPADINGDGVQLYVRIADRTGGWMLVPEAGSVEVRVRVIDGWASAHGISARWEPRGAGYRMVVALPVSRISSPRPSGAEGRTPTEGAKRRREEQSVALDVLVNEKPRGRERRRGQLVLSGARGEFVYLRGDRHDPHRLVPLLLTDA